MIYCTKQQEIYQESQRSDVATGNAGWPSQTQTQTQRCGALRSKEVLTNGVPRKVLKKRFRFRTGGETRSTFSALPRHRVWGRHFPKPFFLLGASALPPQSPKPHPSNPTPATCHKRNLNGSCAAIFGKLCYRSCAATFAFLQCRSHL